MQTDCPTEDVRDRKMERSDNVRMRMRCTIVSKEMRLEKLPHTKDPEFATPASRGKKRANVER